MMKKYFAESELLINEDGSIFHLHLRPEQLADKIILVGAPGRVSLVASHFDSQECEVSSREFHTITGIYKGKRLTVLSTGIGCDNIDIVLNEIDALANIDFKTREEKDTLKSLTLVRVGTCGGLQENTPTGTYIASVKSIGFDGLLNFYAGRNEVCDLPLEAAFKKHMNWNPLLCAPYVIGANAELIDRIAGDDMVRGITNFEMESSALAGLARLLGHKAMTCCMVIANRRAKKAETAYKNDIDGLIGRVLDRI